MTGASRGALWACAAFEPQPDRSSRGTRAPVAIQGALVGVAFWVAGLPNGLFWSVVTMALAILPVVGSGLVWGPAAVILIMQGRTPAGVLMIIWGAVVVGGIDNFIRPILIKRGANIPILLIFSGVIGGLLAFGIVGLFIGPVVLTVTYTLLASWVRTEPADMAR